MDDISLSSFKPRAQPALQHIVVKCKFQRSCKRITFVSTSLSFPLLKNKIEQIFALSALQYFIKYRDDENEITDISCDTDLWEAVEYFSEGSDESSATSSIVSFTSEGVPKVILPVFLELDYDGPSLSETMSYRTSHSEYLRYGSQSSLPVYIKPDGDCQSFVESIPSRYLRRGQVELSIFTGPNISLLCGVLAAIQAPILFSLLDFQAPESIGMRLIHTLFTWSIILYLFGAIIAIVAKLRSAGLGQTPTLPVPCTIPQERWFKRFYYMLCDRAASVARHSAQTFTILGTLCLLFAVLSLMWVTHPLNLHTISMRSILMIVTWIFLACLSYHVFEPSA